MKRIIAVLSTTAALGIGFVAIAGADAPGTGIIVCHDPSGQNPQTLTTPNEASYNAHIGHGDTPGPCPVVEPPTTTTEPPTTTVEEPPTTTPEEPKAPPVGPEPKEPITPQADNGNPVDTTPAPGPADTPEAVKAASRAAAAATDRKSAVVVPDQIGG